jgi:hypothetical protein
MSAAAEARRGLIRAGFGAALCAAAAPPGSLFGSTPEMQCAHLAEIARYIGESDPTMIGAAFLLELDGYERSQLTLLPGEDSGWRRRQATPDPGGVSPFFSAAGSAR